jgi:hypothetical protein
MSVTREIILCIPGPWKDRKALIQSLVDAHGSRYLCVGVAVLDTETSDTVELDLEGPNSVMRKAFYASGLDDDVLDKIGRHQLTAYLHFPLDLPSQRKRMLAWASVFQKAGGIAIKIESCGLSHGWERWHEWMGSAYVVDQYRASVILAGGAEGWYSCGMHHFGLPDATSNAGNEEGHSLLDAFNRYLLVESPKLESGHTFSIGVNSPKWRVEHIEDNRFAEEDLFYNSNGLWSLSRL